MSGSRHARPAYVRDGHPTMMLDRLTLGRNGDDGLRREAFVQDLVHGHPDIIPMADIEPAFMPLISICRELETPAGYLDNLWLTPAGGIVLGECKLVRNPQARREVVSQALDYSRAISEWTYEQLETAVAKALKAPSTTLWSKVSEHTDLDEVQFVDAVERRLRTGRFMMLVIGDGIQEGVEALTRYLQLHAGLHVAMALVDLSMWRMPDGGLVVVPRIPLRTVLIERGVVRIEPSAHARIDPPEAAKGSGPLSGGRIPSSFTLSEEEYYDQLEERRPGLSTRVRSFVTKLEDIGVQPGFRKSLILRWQASPDYTGHAGYIETNGKAWFTDAWNSANKLGHTEAGDRYLTEVARLAGGVVRKYDRTGAAPRALGHDGGGIDVASLLDKEDEWLRAIGALITDTAAPD